jgi:hypothetical protein
MTPMRINLSQRVHQSSRTLSMTTLTCRWCCHHVIINRMLSTEIAMQYPCSCIAVKNPYPTKPCRHMCAVVKQSGVSAPMQTNLLTSSATEFKHVKYAFQHSGASAMARYRVLAQSCTINRAGTFAPRLRYRGTRLSRFSRQKLCLQDLFV